MRQPGAQDPGGLDALETRVRRAALALAAEVGAGRLELRLVEMGRVGTDVTTVDGVEVDPPEGEAYDDLVDALLAHRAADRPDGRRWCAATVTVASGAVALDLDADLPPPPWHVLFRTVGGYLSELERHPRPPSAVPGWMKVELAGVGAWDLRADEPCFTQDFEATGEPQTPESAGVEPPPGAEYAIVQPLPHDDLDEMSHLAIAYAEEEERRTGVFPPEMLRMRDGWG